METNTTNTTTAKGSSVKKWGFISLFGLILILGLVGFGYLGGFGWIANGVVHCKSEGIRSGMLIKFTKKGYIFKTYEGEVVQKNFSTTNDDHWFFSVEDEAVAQQLDKAMIDGKNQHVSLHYCQKPFKVTWQGDSDYFVNKVEFSSGQ